MKRAHKTNAGSSDSSSSSSSDSSSSSSSSDTEEDGKRQVQQKPARRRAPPKKKQAVASQERLRKMLDDTLKTVQHEQQRERQQQAQVQQQQQQPSSAAETFVSCSSAAGDIGGAAAASDVKDAAPQQVASFMDVVDDDIIKYIIGNGHDTLHHLMRLRLVCRRWRVCAQSEEVWGMYRNEIISTLPKPMRLKHEKQLMGSINDPPMKTYAIHMYHCMDESKKLLTSRMSTLKRLQEQTRFPSIPMDYVDKRIEYFVDLKKEHALKRRQLLFHKRFKIGYADCLAPVVNANKKQQPSKPRRRLPLYIGGQLYFVQGDDIDDTSYEDSLQQVGDDAVPTLVFEEHFTASGKSHVVARASSVVGNITCGPQGKKKKKPLSFV